MKFSNHFLSVPNPTILSPHHAHSILAKPHKPNPKPVLCVANSPEPESHSPRLTLCHSLEADTLKALEWSSVCKQLSSFTSTPMGLSCAQKAHIPFGQNPEESRKLLDQTAAAVAAIEMTAEPFDFSGIEDASAIVDSAASGTVLTVRELCTVRRMLRAARDVWEKLEEVALDGDCLERYSPLLEIFRSCDFQAELEQNIGYCIDCNLSILLDRASDELGIIRAERKNNMKNLDSLLKKISAQIFQAGGIDKPLIIKRRSRMCVGIRASHKYLLPDGIVLGVSSSGATYFIEPKEAVDLNNMEVRLSNSEKAEEMAILSLFTSKIAESEAEIKILLGRVLEVDLAFARAAYARWMNGVHPIISSEGYESGGGSIYALSVDIEGIQHPLLLGSSLRNPSDALPSNSVNSAKLDVGYAPMTTGDLSGAVPGFPVPIDIKVECGTRVVVISGPNTGGKTASMKTLGLASLMSKAGMYLPARNHPRLPWFDLVLADIGDHQSIEANLSTFSGHISRICKILEVTSKKSLVLFDEIGSGTDPSEGVALSTSILQYLCDCVKLAVVTTHYADLSLLKDSDTRFQNAAMEFSLETLQPTFRILWGNAGDSNALSIATSIGFDRNIIKRAKELVEQLRPEKQQARKSFLYQSLMDERDRFEGQVRKAACVHAEVMDLYHEIQDEAEDLEWREKALRAKETQRTNQEVKAAKSQIESVVQEFQDNLRNAGTDQFNSFLKKSLSAIASIVEAHRPDGDDDSNVDQTDFGLYTPKAGEQVSVTGLGGKLATVVAAPEDDGTVLVQYGKIRVRVKKNNIRPLPSKSSKSNDATSAVPRFKSQKKRSRELQSHLDAKNNVEISYGPKVQTSKNTVDLRGLRVEEAAHQLDMAISGRESKSVLFVVHGMGTGVVKERALEILENHPWVEKFEQESPLNYGCTVAYIK